MDLTPSQKAIAFRKFLEDKGIEVTTVGLGVDDAKRICLYCYIKYKKDEDLVPSKYEGLMVTVRVVRKISP